LLLRMESKQLADQIAAHQSVNQLKKSLGTELKDLVFQISQKENMVKELSSKVELLNELVMKEKNKLDQQELEGDHNTWNKQSSNVQGDKEATEITPKELEKIRMEFHREKKKAIELAKHEAKIERESAIAALMSRFETDKEQAIAIEKQKILDSMAIEWEIKRQQILLEQENKVQYLKDEVDILREQLEAERENRKNNAELSVELHKQRQAYEQKLAELKEQYERDLKMRDDQISRDVADLRQKMEQGIAQSPHNQMPKLKLEDMEKIKDIVRSISSSIETSNWTEDHMREFLLAQSPTTVKSTTNSAPISSRKLESPKVNQEGMNPLVLRNQLEELKQELSRTNEEAKESLETARIRHNESIRELMNISDKNIRTLELEKETLERNMAKLLAENERLRGEKDCQEPDKDVVKFENETALNLLESSLREKSEMQVKLKIAEENLSNSQTLIENLKSQKSELQGLVQSLEKRIQFLVSEYKRESEELEEEVRADRQMLMLESESIENKVESRNQVEGFPSLPESPLDNTRSELQSIERSATPSQTSATQAKGSSTTAPRQGIRKLTEEQIRKLEEANLKQRKLLMDQVSQLEAKLAEQLEKAHETAQQLKSDAEKERVALQEKHDQFLQGIIAGYEKRIKGLTDALTACLNDNDLIDELKRFDFHQKFRNTRSVL
jgi:hypothetical protein